MKHCWNLIAKVSLDDYILSQHFWSGINVLVERPHVINPKLLAAEILETLTKLCRNDQLIESLIHGEFCIQSIKNIFKNMDSSVKPIEQITKQNKDEDLNEGTDAENNQITLILRSLLPKRVNVYEEGVLEVVILDYLEESATFFPKRNDVLLSPITPAFPYKFKLIEKEIHLEVLQQSSEEKSKYISDSEKWLEMKVLPKVCKWCQNIPKHPAVPSIRLLSAKDYNMTLYDLKTKYGKKFVEVWPEYNNTDPAKYVYEDISIAAYLITLWAEERKSLNLTEKQTFVDLGCGNGFLDHILSAEGHKGIGIDLRKRKIWDLFQPETELKEMIIEPSDTHLFPNYDWIIGNHSDELTPWIPVIAARSSYNMKVFLLPCCFYTFDGKFARSHHDLTQYQSYLNFIETLCQTMGFQVQVDRLRIPSTKRTCFVCTSRTYRKEDEPELEKKRKDFINSHSKKAGKALTNNNQCDNDGSNFLTMSYWNDPETNSSDLKWSADFTPRESVERTQNCTNLDKKTIDEAVMVIFNALLNMDDNYIPIVRDTDTILWNKGGMLKITDLCQLLDQKLLRSMKNQRGGFQTLIRNHKNIFEVKNDFIQLRIPSIHTSSNSGQPRRKRRKRDPKKNATHEMFKQKKCFFHLHHPQHCSLSENDCTFLH